MVGLTFSFDALERRLQEIPDGPSGVLNTPRWVLLFNLAGCVGILVGLLSGLVTIVPYVGVLAGAATGIVIAFFQFESWWSFGAVVAVFVLGQFLEGNFISPRLIGERVGLHPVWIMVALVVGGAVGGLLGVMLAVPVAAAIAVLMRRAVAIYVDSPLYLGRSAG